MNNAPGVSSGLRRRSFLLYGRRQACARQRKGIRLRRERRFPIFGLELQKLEQVVDVVAEVTLEQYPDLDAVPFHSRLGHFDALGVPRLGELERRLADVPLPTRRRCLADLIVTSVLLDAGAGASWSYLEASTDQKIDALKDWLSRVTGGSWRRLLEHS